MQLNIKNTRTVELANELATRTGETVTGAVTRALEERLERVVVRKPTQAQVDAYVERAMAALKPLHDRIRSGELKFPSQEEMDAEMYDEDGLPR